MNLFEVKFKEEGGKIILDSQMYLEDKDGYYFTISQRDGIVSLLEAVIKTIQNNDLESLK